jgi:hypothetical protein
VKKMSDLPVLSMLRCATVIVQIGIVLFRYVIKIAYVRDFLFS